MVMSKKTLAKKKQPSGSRMASAARQMGAGEFKAKVLGLIDEVSETGEPVIVTKRGNPKVALVRYQAPERVPLLGRLQGKYAIHGDLLEPAFPLESYEMLK